MVSDVGTWVQLIVVGSLVARQSGSALQTGLIALATIAPQGMCAPFGGLLADRYDRRRVFIAGLLGQGVVTAVLAFLVASGVRSALPLSGVILLSSAAGSFAAPAYSAMLPDLVPPEELIAMVSLGIYSWNSGRIIGPLLATVLGGVLGPTWTVTFNAVSFGVMALAVASVRRSFLPGGDVSGGVRHRLREGWQALQRTPGCQAAIGVVMLLNVTVAGFMGLIPIYARSVFHGGTQLAGVISAMQGGGAIVGSIAVTVLAVRMRRSGLMSFIVPSLFISFLLYAQAPNTGVACVAVIGLGAGASSFFVSGMAVAQRDAPAAQRGRVLSLVQTAMGACYGIGIVVMGGLGDLFSLRVAFTVGALAFAAGAIAIVRFFPDWRAVVDGTFTSPTHAVQLDDLAPSPGSA